jgi:cystathionine gamma-synthase
MLFPFHANAERCKSFVLSYDKTATPQSFRIVDFILDEERSGKVGHSSVKPEISALVFPSRYFGLAKQFWQHTGCGASSRRAEFCHKLYNEGLLLEQADSMKTRRFCRGPKRYSKQMSNEEKALLEKASRSTQDSHNDNDSNQYIEERFGRNLDLSLNENTKFAIKRRIAGSLTADVELADALQLEKDSSAIRDVENFSEDDIYLYSCGMNAIYNTHRLSLEHFGHLKSISFGYVLCPRSTTDHFLLFDSFPYIDTLKILEKFGPGCRFYGSGSATDLDDLQRRLQQGERYLALFCEFPSNPLLNSPDLKRIRRLADEFNFLVIVDETIGNFLNVNVLPFADVVVSSLTKVFSGDSNVMGGRYGHQGPQALV